MSPSGPSARTIIELNIAHYRNLLKDEANESKRQTIAKLLAEEEAKLARLLAQRTKTNESSTPFQFDVRFGHSRQCVGSTKTGFRVAVSIHPLAVRRAGESERMHLPLLDHAELYR
jgi:hypothetical protein